MTVEAMEYYRLLEPTWAKTIGQGDPPTCMVIVKDGRRYELPYGAEFRASDTCDPENGVANLDSDPMKLRCHIIEEFSDQFEHVPQS